MPPRADPAGPGPVRHDGGRSEERTGVDDAAVDAEPADTTGIPEIPEVPETGEPVDWTGLPPAIRERVAELAAAALGKLPTADVPRQLRPVAKFAPAKRARLGATALLATLGDSGRFRAAVLEWLREHRLDALDPNAADSVAAASASLLLGEADAGSRVRLVARNAEESALRAERDSALARTQQLESELERTRQRLAETLSLVDQVRAEREEELVKLRNRLRRQGVVLREARDEVEQARVDAERGGTSWAEKITELTTRLEREHRRAATEHARAERATAEAEMARQSAREARQADEVRLALLADTIDGAVAGLRRELSLTPGRQFSSRPADTVRGVNPARGLGPKVDDPVALERLLVLPSLHVIVDGYNVTKTGYPELVLADQRNRLTNQLSALASRTGAEVTVVFDGTGLSSLSITTQRAVRVLFSEAGVLADDVIRELVAAEPDGRPVLVVTSDRAVVESVRRGGAYAAPSAVFLSRLGRV